MFSFAHTATAMRRIDRQPGKDYAYPRLTSVAVIELVTRRAEEEYNSTIRSVLFYAHNWHNCF